jgi:hypothetical protein
MAATPTRSSMTPAKGTSSQPGSVQAPLMIPASGSRGPGAPTPTDNTPVRLAFDLVEQRDDALQHGLAPLVGEGFDAPLEDNPPVLVGECRAQVDAAEVHAHHRAGGADWKQPLRARPAYRVAPGASCDRTHRTASSQLSEPKTSEPGTTPSAPARAISGTVWRRMPPST